jgi:hypothetical protein
MTVMRGLNYTLVCDDDAFIAQLTLRLGRMTVMRGLNYTLVCDDDAFIAQTLGSFNKENTYFHETSCQD